MLFPIKYIKHDIEKVYEIPFHFFTTLQEGKIKKFCPELFPKWLRGNFKGKIKAEFEKLYNLLMTELDEQQRQQLYKDFFKNNHVKEICTNEVTDFALISDLPNIPISSKTVKSIRDFIKELFTWLYTYILTHDNSPITSLLKSDIKNILEFMKKKIHLFVHFVA